MSGACIDQSGFYLPWWRMGGNDKRKNIPQRTSTSEVARPKLSDAPRGTTPAHASERNASTDSFDLWLNKKLTVLYGPVVDEPIPEDLVELIRSQGRSNEER